MIKKILVYSLILLSPLLTTKIQSMYAPVETPPLEAPPIEAPPISISGKNSNLPYHPKPKKDISELEFTKLLDSIARAKTTMNQFSNWTDIYAFPQAPTSTIVSCSKKHQNNDNISCYVIVNKEDKNWSFSEDQAKLLWKTLYHLHLENKEQEKKSMCLIS